ncbi:MAG: aminotransferase class V-fold PLP-dependent enzyme [Deltaproteobacteria bacterium]|nr:aminotransferase class V-fold PLP-dependent enzyme [Candidatus Tharpella aukensis]
MIYLDNAATSFPKPKTVSAAMLDYLDNIGASPGRSGHQLAAAAGRILFQARKALTRLFKLNDPRAGLFLAKMPLRLSILPFLACCGRVTGFWSAALNIIP